MLTFLSSKEKKGKRKKKKEVGCRMFGAFAVFVRPDPCTRVPDNTNKMWHAQPNFSFFSLPPLSVFSLLLCLPHLKAYPVSWQYNPGVFLTFVFTTGGLFVCHTKERKDLKVHDNLLRMKELKWLSCARIYLKMLDNAYEKALVKSWTNSNAPSFHYFIV